MNFAKLRIFAMIVFLCLGVVVSMDEYANILHEIEKGDTVDMILNDYFAKEKTQDKEYRIVLKDMLKEWNPHIKDWEQLPIGIKINVSRPKSPFLGKH